MLYSLLSCHQRLSTLSLPLADTVLHNPSVEVYTQIPQAYLSAGDTRRISRRSKLQLG